MKRAPSPRRSTRAFRYERLRALLPPLLVLAAALALDLRTLHYPFLNWDDPDYVLNNPWIRAWSWENLIHIFTRPYAANFLPLHLVSYLIDYRLWGLDPFGYHLHSVLLHAANAVLVLAVVGRLLGNRVLALLAGLFFAIHPAHVEAIAWISIRKDLLATLFGLIAVLAYLGATDRGRVRGALYAASVLAFGLALLSKVTVVTLPLFLFVWDRWGSSGGGRPGWRGALARQVPFALLGLGAVALNAMAQIKAEAPYVQDPLAYLMVKGEAAWRYVGLLLGVIRGSPDYDLPAHGRNAWAVARSLAGLSLLPLGAWVAHRAGSRSAFLGCVWIFATLLPALAFPLVTYMADRYLYTPAVGVCWMAAAGIVALGARAGSRRAVVTVSLAALLLAGWTARSLQALPIWRSSEALWTYALTRSQDWRAYVNLAEVRLAQGRYAEAERLLRVSARVENVTTYQNFAVLYFELGRYDEALAAMARAFTILRRKGWDPVQASVLYYSLGAIHARMGRPEKAVEALEAALRENPANAQARDQLAAFRN